MFATSRASLSAVVRASTTQKTQKIQTTTTTATARDDANVDETRRGRRMALLSASVTLGAMTLGAGAARAVKGPGEELLAKRLEEEAKSRERIDALYRELRAEEAKALELRREKEGEAQEELNKFREESEAQSRQQVLAGKTLCVTPFGIDIVGITEFVALAGAVASGISANQKKEEITMLNDKLRKINASLMSTSRASMGTDASVLEAARGGAAKAAAATMSSVDDWDTLSEDMKELKLALREGRKLLRADEFAAALNAFKKSLMLARVTGDLVSVRRATRGLGAAKRQLGDRVGAIADLKEVLNISQQLDDNTGDMDALGAIADLYTELGDLENAGRYYDLYLNQINDETVEIED